MLNSKRYFSILVMVVSILITAPQLVLATTGQVPSFPMCTSFETDGNWSSSDNTYHSIPGLGNGFYGKDDVYNIGDGNFVQCYCGLEGNGIQTNWWNFGELSQEAIGGYQNDGWLLENGSNWNLFQVQYLAKNSEYDCGEPEATPTPTPSPTPTSTPESENHSSECVLLEANVNSGTAPLTVNFQASGADSKNYVEEYEFNFNDNSGGQPQIVRSIYSGQSHRYEKAGTYTASVMIKDSKGVWKTSDKCQTTVQVYSEPQVLGASTTNELPSTGIPYFALGFLVTGTLGAGLYLKVR